MMNFLRSRGVVLWGWFRERAHGPHARGWLVSLSLFEPIFSPLMPETLMVPMILAGGGKWKLYATAVVVFTTVGCGIGYLIGALFFDAIGLRLLEFYNLTNFFGEAKRLMTIHAFATMFWISFTPLPDKVFVLAGGFLAVPFAPFILGCLVGRALRVYLIAYIAHRYGEQALALTRRYFAALAVVAIIILAALFIGLVR